MAQTSQIVIDQVTSGSIAAGTVTLQHNITSPDAVLAVLVVSIGPGNASVTVNGTNVPVSLATTNTAKAYIFYMTSPPVGTVSISVIGGSASIVATAVSLLGVDKANLSPVVLGSTAATGTLNTTVQVPQANAMMLSVIADSNLDTLVPTQSDQSIIISTPVAGVSAGASSFRIVAPGLQTIGYSGPTGTVAQSVIVLEPAHPPSMWFPNIDLRNDNDTVGTTGQTIFTGLSLGNHPTTFWQNSFLHTVGRIIRPPASVFTLVAETELETSQIVIDKITQQAVGSGTSAISDHLVSSQDAVMLIFASQMGVSQALNSVNLNGVPLNALGNPSISTLTAGAYFVVNPNVGINTISSSVTLPTALELIVITLLGVDKRTANPIFTANSGLTGSPSSSISPAAANSLIIDFVGSLGTSISEDASQTAYFDQPQAASEAAGSIKLSTVGQQTMSWTTLSTAWVQLAVALEPANALSIWYPAIDARNLSDVIAVNNLDDSVNPVGNFYQTYGAHPTQYWQNSFLHTIGRIPHANTTPVVTQQPLELQLLGIG